MDNIPTYCARKHGKEAPEYPHPLIEPALRETYGVIIYQEQVMQIAQVLSGYSLGEADLLRRAMGKKIRAEMDAQRDRFVKGAVERDIPKEQANTIFDLLAKFADYGFNKSHAAAYALIAYQTAYLKANYPVEFIAASMTLDAGNTDKLNDFRREAIRLGIKVDAPSVAHSGVEFDVKDGRILYSLAALKGVGSQAARHVVAERDKRPFSDLADFASRIDPRILNKRTLESFICAGALDMLEPDRARLFAGADRIIGFASRAQTSAEEGQNELFAAASSNERLRLPPAEHWTSADKLQREHAVIGFYFSSHPLDQYAQLLARMRVQTYAQFAESVRGGASAGRLAGTVTAKQERRTRTGGKMGIIQLSDPSGAYEAVLFSEALNEFRELLEPGNSVVVLVGAEERPEGVSIRIQSVEPLDRALGSMRQLRVFLNDPGPLKHVEKALPGRGETDVSLVLSLDGGKREVEVKLPGRFAVTAGTASALRGLPGVAEVELV
jgi:DNA polymerase-3 subunit alpha